MKFLSLLVAGVSTVGTMVNADQSACFKNKDRIITEGELPGWKSDALSVNKKVGETVSYDGLCNADSHPGMWTVAMVIDQNFRLEDRDMDHWLTFVILNENCKVMEIRTPEDKNKGGGDCPIMNGKFPLNPKEGRNDRLQLFINRYSFDTNEKDREGSFAFTYGAYHGETSYKSNGSSSSYPSCHKVVDGGSWRITACRHRFPLFPSSSKRSIEFSA